MKKLLLITIFIIANCIIIQAQNHKILDLKNNDGILKRPVVDRFSFPSDFVLVQLDVTKIIEILQNAPKRFSDSDGALLSLPNADGGFDNFKTFEYSNFEPALQAKNPLIKSYFAVNVKDGSILRMSVSPDGIQFISFKADETEYMEPYSVNLPLYAVYKTSRTTRELPLSCTSEDTAIANNLSADVGLSARSSSAELLTFRLALSCTGEYGSFFGGNFSSVLAQMNVTMTNVNAVFERDLGIRMNIIANNSLVMFYNASTDPYSAGSVGAGGAWSNELEATLNAQLGLAAFDVGHLFGATGGGGNAGCIGCVCFSNKGRGYTSPGSGPASGPGFDIDYVAHEFGHQFGGRHTFSHGGINGNEFGPASVEVGSGSTIMSYAGISGAYDIVNAASPYFHGFSVQQIQNNMVGKLCPLRTPKNNVAPVVSAGQDYTIPILTPFVLRGSATDANGDALTYCWEQNDSATIDQGTANSTAGAFKIVGPNFRSYLPTPNPLRYFPLLSRTINNQKSTNGISPNMLSEALSSTSRTLNFMLTVRDNSVNGGLTKRDDMVVEVNQLAGPFEITAPNTAISWPVATNQTVTWSVAGTTTNGVNAKFVDIFLSTDGGLTYTIVLAAKVPNDGSETIVVPNNAGGANRIMVKGFEHIFFDISNVNFIITAPPSTFALKTLGTADSQNKAACQGASIIYTLPYETYGGFSGTTFFSASGLPTGVVANFNPTSLNANGTVTLTLTNTAGITDGLYGFLATATSGSISKILPLYLEVVNATFGIQNLSAPADNVVGQPVNVPLSWGTTSGATSYRAEVATDNTFNNIVGSNTSATTSWTAPLFEGITYFWRVLPINLGCNGTYSLSRKFTTGQTICPVFSNNSVVAISANGTPTITSTISIPSGAAITDVNVSVNISHTNANQLTGILTNPQGTQVYLFANPCNASAQNIITTFDDETGVDFACAPGGPYRPATSLDALDNVNSMGIWTLQILDNTSGGGGSLNSWNIEVCGFQALSNVKSQLAGFALYPNPTNGNFSLKFDGDADSSVHIAIYDVRGRVVFDRKYNDGNNFSENLNIENLDSGLYFVTIQNGDIKVTKRIIKH